MKTKKIELEIRDNSELSLEEIEERMITLAYKIAKSQSQGFINKEDFLEVAKAILEVGDLYNMLNITGNVVK